MAWQLAQKPSNGSDYEGPLVKHDHPTAADDLLTEACVTQRGTILDVHAIDEAQVRPEIGGVEFLGIPVDRRHFGDVRFWDHRKTAKQFVGRGLRLMRALVTLVGRHPSTAIDRDNRSAPGVRDESLECLAVNGADFHVTELAVRREASLQREKRAAVGVRR